MGLQRHLKVLGIFARIHYRDGKPRLPRGHAALLDYARAVASALRASWRRSRGCSTSTPRERHPSHESDDPRRRPRRAHAAADRRHAQAAARGRRQAADRLAPRAPGARRLPRSRHQRLAPRRAASRARSATARGYGLRHRAIRASRARSRPPAASRTRCRCSATSRSSWSTPTSTATSTFGRAATRRRSASALAHLVLVPNPPHHPRGDFALARRHGRQRRARRATLTRHRRS